MSTIKQRLDNKSPFLPRHVGNNAAKKQAMLQTIGLKSLDELIDKTIPASIRMDGDLKLGEGVGEYEYLNALKGIAARNKIFKSYIGLGYYDCITPAPILRNIFQNPGWYTAYTPYQAEIAQGRLEALLNFQTMVEDLTGMPIANASLLDEGTAAAEAMAMLHRSRSRNQARENANRFQVAKNVFPQTIDLLMTRAEPLGIDIELIDPNQFDFKPDVFGLLLQYPDANGAIQDYSELIERAHQHEIRVTLAADLLALALLKSPGEMGADVVVGNSQRFGVPMGYGGPHAGYFATREDFKRQVPGRIIGVSVDRLGNNAYRMALQTREQHIRREKATSNICTAQTLLAVMAGMYAVYHGPEGIRDIASRVHAAARILDQELSALGFRQLNAHYFGTLHLDPGAHLAAIREGALQRGMNFRYTENGTISISIDETTGSADLQAIVLTFAKAAGQDEKRIDFAAYDARDLNIRVPELRRSSAYLQHPVFNSFHTESELMRYIKRLENRDLSLTSSMIPLGSCTMKLNAATELIPVSWPEFAALHPFAPADQAEGYRQVFEELERELSEITGFAAVSLQPNSGAQGEYAGMMVIRAYHHDRGDKQRTVVLIPSSAHGTNPASAIMAGLEVVTVKCDEMGNIDVDDLREKAEAHREVLAALMVTYPSTHGVFEARIKEVCQIVHQNGGQVYMDGANMNAQVALTNPGLIGADVCHLNLHKTFAIPHGGGGPGVGPIGVAAHLAPYLPGNPVVKTGGEKAITAISSAPWGSASICLISYGYLKMLGKGGLKEATRQAILNANYIKARLQEHYPVLYVGENGTVAHELIFDIRPFKADTGVEVEDIAKRLMD
ncbi:MAG: aminomethyl-transferring glycine dehydrogenase, partial [Calditrichaeota bacterium]|nr:aminomethyl-transferring glycine dehydrogenase [Calditrichota bacterium]